MELYWSTKAGHHGLRDVFKGRFTTISPATIEVDVTWYMLRSQPGTVSVSADSKAEYDYLPKAKTTSNPRVLNAFKMKGKQLKRFEGQSLKQVKGHIRRSGVVDIDVENRHGYRMIASWVKGKKEPTYGVTNPPRSDYPASTIIQLYSLRWQIELLFKEWKSYCNLRKFNTRKATMMEGLGEFTNAVEKAVSNPLGW